MSDFFSRGFSGRRRVAPELAERLPPGQYVEQGFPVLTAGPTPRVGADEWTLTIDGIVAAPQAPGGLDRRQRRIDAELIAPAAAGAMTAYVCGSNGFVETATGLLLEAGVAPAWIRTERFGPTG